MMNGSLKIHLPEPEIEAFCRRWKVVELSIFGSALRADFGPHSDVDLLVTFTPDAHWTLFDLVHMRDELESLIGRKVDLVSRRGVESSRNPIRKESILTSAEVVYAA